MAPPLVEGKQRRQCEQRSQLEKSGSSDTDSQTEDDGKATLLAKRQGTPEVLCLSGDEEDVEMVYTGPKITQLAPIQLSSDSDRESRREDAAPSPTRPIRRKTPTENRNPGPSVDAPTAPTPSVLSSPATSRRQRLRTSTKQQKSLGPSRRSKKRRPCSSTAVENEFTDYTSSEGELKEQPSSSQEASAVPSSPASTSAARGDTDDDAVICNVCKCTLVRGAVRLAPCGHKYHRSCLDDWLSRKKKAFQTCPLCRQPPNEIRRVIGGRKVRIPSPVPDGATSEEDEMLTGVVFSEGDDDDEDYVVDEAEAEESDSNFSDDCHPSIQRAIQRSLSEPLAWQAEPLPEEPNRSSSVAENIDAPASLQHFPPFNLEDEPFEPREETPFNLEEAADDAGEESVAMEEEDDIVEVKEEKMDVAEEGETGDALSSSPSRPSEEILAGREEVEPADVVPLSPSRTDSDDDGKESDDDRINVTSRKRVLTRRRQKKEAEDSDASDRREEEEKKRAITVRRQRMVEQEEREMQRIRASLRCRSSEDHEKGEEEARRRALRRLSILEMEDEEEIEGSPPIDMEASDQEAEEEEEARKSDAEGGEKEVEDLDGGEDAEALTDEEVPDHEDESSEKQEAANGEEPLNKKEKEDEVNAVAQEKQKEDEHGEEENRGESRDGMEEEKIASQSLPSPFEQLPLAPPPEMRSPPPLDFSVLAASQIPPEAAEALAVAMTVPVILEQKGQNQVTTNVQLEKALFMNKMRLSMHQVLQQMLKEEELLSNDLTVSHEDAPSSSVDYSSRQNYAKSTLNPLNAAFFSSSPNSPLEGHRTANSQEMLASSSLAPSSSKDQLLYVLKPLKELKIPQQLVYSRSSMDSECNSEQSERRKKLIDRMRHHMYDQDVVHPSPKDQFSPSLQYEQASPTMYQQTQSAPHSSQIGHFNDLNIRPMSSSHSYYSGEPPVKKAKLIKRLKTHMYDYFNIVHELEQREDMLEEHEEPSSSMDPRHYESMLSTTTMQHLNRFFIPPAPSPPPRKYATRTPSVIVEGDSTEMARDSCSESPTGASDNTNRILSPTSLRRHADEQIELLASTMPHEAGSPTPTPALTNAQIETRASIAPQGRPQSKKRKTIPQLMDESLAEWRAQQSDNRLFVHPATIAADYNQPSISGASSLMVTRSPLVPRMSTPEINSILTWRVPEEEEANLGDEQVNEALKDALDAWYHRVLRAGGRVGKRMLTTAIKMALQSEDAIEMGKRHTWIPACDWEPERERTSSVASQTRRRPQSPSPEVSPPPPPPPRDSAVTRAEFNAMLNEMAAMKRRLAEVEKRT